jgi:hypothetical protein
MINKKSRKGQVAILMLFLVAIVLVIAALVSFAVFDRKFDNGSVLNSYAMSDVSLGYGYVFATSQILAKEAILSGNADLKFKFKELASFRGKGIEQAGNFFKKISEGDFAFALTGGEYKLEVKGLFVQSSYGNNEIRRNYDLCLVFGLDGNYLRKC